jgi:hypothetical protein
MGRLHRLRENTIHFIWRTCISTFWYCKGSWNKSPMGPRSDCIWVVRKWQDKIMSLEHFLKYVVYKCIVTWQFPEVWLRCRQGAQDVQTSHSPRYSGSTHHTTTTTQLLSANCMSKQLGTLHEVYVTSFHVHSSLIREGQLFHLLVDKGVPGKSHAPEW